MYDNVSQKLKSFTKVLTVILLVLIPAGGITGGILLLLAEAPIGYVIASVLGSAVLALLVYYGSCFAYGLAELLEQQTIATSLLRQVAHSNQSAVQQTRQEPTAPTYPLRQTGPGPRQPMQPPAAPQPETPAGFWPALSEKLRAALPAKISGFFAVNGPIHPVLQGEVLIMAADSDFVLDLVKKTPDTEALVREKASAILGKTVSVRFALKNRLSRLGDDPMDALVQFGQQHSDIFTIK